MCLSYIGRSSRQAIKFDLSINLYGPIDLGLYLARSSTSLYPSLAKLPGKKKELETPIVCFQESSDACHLIEC